MRRARVVRSIRTGEVFRETSPREFDKAHAAWLADPKNNPCPMPRGHLMFKYPEKYGCERVDC